MHFNHRPALNPLQKQDLDSIILGGDPGESCQPAVAPSLKTCDKVITLDCLRALYKIDYTPRSTDQNTFGIGSFICVNPIFLMLTRCYFTVEFTPQAYLGPDLDMFFRYIRSCHLPYTYQ